MRKIITTTTMRNKCIVFAYIFFSSWIFCPEPSLRDRQFSIYPMAYTIFFHAIFVAVNVWQFFRLMVKWLQFKWIPCPIPHFCVENKFFNNNGTSHVNDMSLRFIMCAVLYIPRDSKGYLLCRWYVHVTVSVATFPISLFLFLFAM